jgi:hypothetical protein
MNQRLSNPQIALKPQDLVVLLKLCVTQRMDDLTYGRLAHAVALTRSEAHAAVARLKAARLVQARDNRLLPVRDAVREFVLFGAPYAFPAVGGEPSRGLATAWAAPPLKGKIAAGATLPPVWPTPDGTSNGVALYPLYPTVPVAAAREPKLYEMLALVDALRAGRARERNLARRLIEDRLK